MQDELLQNITCYTCGTVIPMTARRNEILRETSASFFCVNGHSNIYKKSTTELLREELAASKLALKASKGETDRYKRNCLELEEKLSAMRLADERRRKRARATARKARFRVEKVLSPKKVVGRFVPPKKKRP